MRLCAPLLVCWHVCKNREGLETIPLQPRCLRYISLRLTFNENTWQYLFLSLFCLESVQCNHQLRMDVYTRPLRGCWRKWKKSSPHEPGTVFKQKSPSPHNVCSPVSAPTRRWVSSSPVHWWKTTSNKDTCVWRISSWESWQRPLD